jgi:hypothetical protein
VNVAVDQAGNGDASIGVDYDIAILQGLPVGCAHMNDMTAFGHDGIAFREWRTPVPGNDPTDISDSNTHDEHLLMIG